MTATCDLCGAESLDLHTFERCGDCCTCREDLAGELLALAEVLTDHPSPIVVARIGLALTHLAARLPRTGEAGR